MITNPSSLTMKGCIYWGGALGSTIGGIVNIIRALLMPETESFWYLLIFGIVALLIALYFATNLEKEEQQ